MNLILLETHLVNIKRKPQLVKVVDYYSSESDKIRQGFWIRSTYHFTRNCYVKCDINEDILFDSNRKYILYETSLFEYSYYGDDILKEYQRRLASQSLYKKNKVYSRTY
jgi:hypothetical protein